MGRKRLYQTLFHSFCDLYPVEPAGLAGGDREIELQIGRIPHLRGAIILPGSGGKIVAVLDLVGMARNGGSKDQGPRTSGEA